MDSSRELSQRVAKLENALGQILDQFPNFPAPGEIPGQTGENSPKTPLEAPTKPPGTGDEHPNNPDDTPFELTEDPPSVPLQSQIDILRQHLINISDDLSLVATQTNVAIRFFRTARDRCETLISTLKRSTDN